MDSARLHIRLRVALAQRSPADFWNDRNALVGVERACRRWWMSSTDEERRRTQRVVRAALANLYHSDAWLPGSVVAGRGRLDIHVVVELMESYPDAGSPGLVEDLEIITRETTYRAIIADLQAMVADLEDPKRRPPTS